MAHLTHPDNVARILVQLEEDVLAWADALENEVSNKETTEGEDEKGIKEDDGEAG